MNIPARVRGAAARAGEIPDMASVVVVEHRPEWAAQFEALRARLWPAVQDLALGIEHVGSTSVVGLAAKPILDVDIVIESAARLPAVVERLGALGYRHRGDLGIPGREAFAPPPDAVPQNLYVCLEGGVALRNHRLLRDRLRRDDQARDRYAALKRDLARRHPDDIDAYVAAKTELILEMLADEGMDADAREGIRAANESPPPRL